MASTEPSYTSGSTNSLYFVDFTVFGDDTFKYSGASLSTSYESAKEAYNKGIAVNDRIASVETLIEQNTTAIALRATKTELNALVEGKLIVNGFDLNKDDYNFSQWTYDGINKCDGFPSFKYTDTPRDLYIPQYIIPIYITKKYEFRISATYCTGIEASTTALAQDLKNGDTVVHLTSTAGWTSATLTHQLGLIFWNYTDSTGYQYPVGVYSRNTWMNLYTFANVNKTEKGLTKRPYVNARYIHCYYDGEMTIEKAYGWLKTQEDFYEAEDV